MNQPKEKEEDEHLRQEQHDHHCRDRSLQGQPLEVALTIAMDFLDAC